MRIVYIAGNKSSSEMEWSMEINSNQMSKKNRNTTLVLCYLLGFIGVHYFYVGRIGRGVLYLCTLGLFGIGWIIDMILIATVIFMINPEL